MACWALDSLQGIDWSRLVIVALAEHESCFRVSSLLGASMVKKPHFVWLPEVTEGQLCTVLAARSYLNSDDDLLVLSADTYVRGDLGRHIETRESDCHGIISTARMPGTQWSFARTDAGGDVVEVSEKVRISDHVSTGIYYFSRTKEFLEVADEIVGRGETTHGEYYVMPVYNKYLRRGWRVTISEAAEMWDMGTPFALSAFERHIAASQA